MPSLGYLFKLFNIIGAINNENQITISVDIYKPVVFRCFFARSCSVKIFQNHGFHGVYPLVAKFWVEFFAYGNQ